MAINAAAAGITHKRDIRTPKTPSLHFDYTGNIVDKLIRRLYFEFYRRVYGQMNAKQVVAALGAIAHDHRLAVYRLLVKRGPQGSPAGEIATQLDMPPSSLTFHLQQMLHSGLITQRRLGRQLIYAVDFAAMNGLVSYLTENCCGSAEGCAPACNPAASAKPRKQRRSA